MYSQLILHFTSNTFYYLTLCVSGLIIGSFLSMLTYRLPRNLSLSGRSYCDKCHKTIKWIHNIPLISFLILKGRCAYCGKGISKRYMFIEFFTAILFVGIGYLWQQSTGFHGLTVHFFKETFDSYSIYIFLALFTIFWSLSIIDFETQILPDELVYLSLAIVSLFVFVQNDQFMLQKIMHAYMTFVFFLLIYLLTKGRGMGFGDVKLSLVIGLLFPFTQLIVWFLLAFLSGSIVGIILLAFRKARLGEPIPFGPFMLFSALVTAIWGDRLFVWYINFLS